MSGNQGGNGWLGFREHKAVSGHPGGSGCKGDDLGAAGEGLIV